MAPRKKPNLDHIEPDLRKLARPISKFKLDPKNAKKHDARSIAEIKTSLAAHGQKKPIVVAKDGMVIKAGNGTVRAAKLLGWSHIAAVVSADADRLLREYALRDNRSAELAAWDIDVLLEEIDDLGFEPDDVGWNADEVQELIGDLGGSGGAGGANDPGPSFDRAEELRKKWGVETGQLWVLGEHRLLCGDSTKREDVDQCLGEHHPLLMVTDPPYGVNYDPDWRNKAAAEGKLAYAASRVGKVKNDDRVDWSAAYRLFPGDVAYTWSPPGDNVILTGLVLQKSGFEIRNQIVWRKPHFPISRGHYTYQHEPCWYGVKKGKTAHWIGEANESTVWKISLDKNVDGGHSTQKPLECMSRPIRNHDSKHVYDPFCGSGTTIIACEQLSRACCAIEIDPGYVAVALQRWADATGGEPVHIP